MPSRCPSCQSFVSLHSYINLLSDYAYCRSCGLKIHVPSVFDVALVSGTRRAETQTALSSVAQGVAFQNGPQGNAQDDHLTPTGKLKPKKPLQAPINQLSLFGGFQ
jgi:hypothetical protein